MTYNGVHPITLVKKSLVILATNSEPSSEEISVGTPKMTKIRRTTLHSPFAPELLVPTLISCSVQPDSLSAATKFYDPLE